MSNAKIRNLLYATLIEGLTENAELSILVRDPAIILTEEYEKLYTENNNIWVSLIPAPAVAETLGGDGIRYTGIYQMDVKILLKPDEVNANLPLNDIQDKLQEIFKVDMLIEDSQGFWVQIINPLKTSEAKQFGQWWTCHCYFDYRADSN